MRMLSHSEVLGILIFTKDAFWPHFDVFAKVTGHFVPKLFRTQVIKVVICGKYKNLNKITKI